MPSVESAKLLFIQLPQQDTQGESAADNVPFSSARLLAYAEERGALKRDTATILDQDALDFGGDAAICSAAVRGLPELIIFHLETWNLDRSVWMARRLRALMPATHIAAFGPAAAESAELLKEQAFDALVEGEAESAFLELLGDLGHRVIKPRYRGKIGRASCRERV